MLQVSDNVFKRPAAALLFTIDTDGIIENTKYVIDMEKTKNVAAAGTFVIDTRETVSTGTPRYCILY